MDVYVVWKQPHDDIEDCYMGDENIVGVYINELIAYKTACVKQVTEYLNNCDDDVHERTEDWLQDNPFPDAEEPNVDVWKTYYKIVTPTELAYTLHDATRGDELLYNTYHVTKKDVQMYS